MAACVDQNGNHVDTSASESQLQVRQQIDQQLAKFVLSDEQMRQMKQIFQEEMTLGYAQKPDRQGCLLMMNTYITRGLDEHQLGSYLSLDLGSTNFRVCHLQFVKGERNDRFHVKYYDIPAEFRSGPASPLFNHIAKCIKSFVDTEMPDHNPNAELPLGFTFSFPMVQKSIDSALLTTWTKSYNIPEVVGNNPTEFLQKAIDQLSLKVKVVALINDSTGTLVKGLYLDSRCNVGVIMGTGFNICFTENDVSKIEKWNEERKAKYPNVEKVMVDIECGAFGDNGCIDFIKTDIDLEIDSKSLFPKSFSFEKLLAGKFLGHIGQLILRELVKKQLILNGKISEQLTKEDNFPTSFISHIEGENSDEWVQKAFEHLGYLEYNKTDEYALRSISKNLSVRSSQLVSTLIAAILDWIDEPDSVVAIDGSLYKYHPKIAGYMRNFIQKLLKNDKKFDLILAEDGSGKGAGLVASIAQHL